MQFKIPTRVFRTRFFRITDLNFNNQHDHKTAGRRAWLHHRWWWWNPTLALCIHLCLTAAKRKLILQLAAQADSPVESCRICYKFKFRNRLFLTLKPRNIWRFLKSPAQNKFMWIWVSKTSCFVHLLTGSWFCLWQKQELPDAAVTAWLVGWRFRTLTLRECWAANVLKGWLTEEELIISPGPFTLI